MKWCIKEEIKGMFEIFVVAIPADKNDKILVSFTTVPCINGMFYYDNNTVETREAWEDEKKVLTPEWAKENIIGYKEGMKLSPVSAYCSYYMDRAKADKLNEKLQRKLESLTVHQFYNTNYR